MSNLKNKAPGNMLFVNKKKMGEDDEFLIFDN